METKNLTGQAINWAVAKCEGVEVADGFDDTCPEYSSNWSEGGPIIEREKYESMWLPRQQEWYVVRKQHATDGHIINCGFGPTLLIAAMRCYVASKLGNDIDIPKELC
jgi:hypothetical protein